MEKEKAKVKSGNVVDFKVLKRLFQYAKPYIKQFYLLVFLTIFLAILTPIRPILVQKAIDEYVPNGDYDGLVLMITILIGHLIVLAVVQYSHTYLSGWVGQTIIKDIRTKLFNHLIRLKLKQSTVK